MTERKRASGAFAYICVAFLAFLFFAETDASIEYVKKGISVCVKNVVPALFPFTVLSAVMAELGLSDIVSGIIGRPLGRIFGVSAAGSAVPFMGALCGFPIGAISAMRLYRSGRISREDVSRLMLFSNNPSSAFLIGAVGSALWSCERLGVVLYFIQLLSAFLIGVFQSVFTARSEEKRVEERGTHSQRGLSSVLVDAISDAAYSSVGICAFIMFFAAFVGALCAFLGRFFDSQLLRSLIYCIFEMSGAVSEATRLGNTEFAVVLTAFACGWSGLSVHFQIFSVCRDAGISKGAYLLAKAVQGALSAIMMALYLKFIDSGLLSECVPVFLPSHSPQKASIAFALTANAMLLIGIILFLFRLRARKRL